MRWRLHRQAVQALPQPRPQPRPAHPPAGDAGRVAAAGADDGEVDVLGCAAVQRHLDVPLHGSHLQQQRRWLGRGQERNAINQQLRRLQHGLPLLPRAPSRLPARPPTHPLRLVLVVKALQAQLAVEAAAHGEHCILGGCLPRAAQQAHGVVAAQGDGGALGCRIGLPRHKVEQRDIRLSLAAAGEGGGEAGRGRIRVVSLLGQGRGAWGRCELLLCASGQGQALGQQQPAPETHSEWTAPSTHLFSGFRPLARGMSRRKCLATRSVRPLLIK